MQIISGSGAARHVTYKSFATYDEAADLAGFNMERLAEVSAGLLRRAELIVSSRGGWVYAIATAPDVSRRRIKIGFTTDLRRRFGQHKTTNPTAVILAAWEATRSDEARAHRAVSGRIGASEVFLVNNLNEAVRTLGEALGPAVEPMTGARRPQGSAARLVDRNFATAKQGRPRPNTRAAVADLVIVDIRGRQELGQRRYGVDLQANNGRDALVDAYQEAIDLAMYLRQLLEERGITPEHPPFPAKDPTP